MLKMSEKIFVIAMLFYTARAVFPFITAYLNRGVRLEGNHSEQLLQLFFYIGAMLVIAIHWQTVVNAAWNVKWILGLVVLAIVSAAWSQDPVFTLRRSATLVALTLFGIYFGSRFTVPEQLRLLTWTCALVEVCSFLTVILLPKYGVDHLHHHGDWQGVFLHKNVLARFMVLTVLVFYFVRPWGWRNAVRWVGIAGAIVLLAFSGSVTGLIAFVAIIATLPLYRLCRAKITVVIPVLIAVALLAMGLFPIFRSSSAQFFQLLHRSPSLTGRTDLWNAVMIPIMKRPFLGFGFDGFWRGMTGESATVWLALGWEPPHAHNGFLDLVLDLGLLGLTVFTVGYFAQWRGAIELVKKTPGSVSLWLCTYLVFIFTYNLAESSLLAGAEPACTECSSSIGLFWVLYAATAAGIFLNSPTNTPAAEIGTDLDS
jgi:O-antigen ligase